jgi:hypothetical protein
MPERVVVTFRGVANVEVDDGQMYLARVAAIKQRFEAAGAKLCAWGAETFSFELGARDFEVAVGLAVEVAKEDAPEPSRFRVGMAMGRMIFADEGGEGLAWGAPLLIASSLAKAARPGEVLLDPKLVASRPGELLLQGTRLAMDAGRKVRGARLDVRQPWRKLAAKDVAQLKEPELLGRDAILAELAVPLGCVGIVRAGPGSGGTRLLAELTQKLAPSRSLLITPVGASREPLGAVRRALARSAALHGRPELPEHLKDALTKLIAGGGTDRWSAAELLDAWLGPTDGKFGVLTVDDASELDPMSLEVIATSLRVRGSFRVIVRLDEDEPVPEQLSAATVGTIVTASHLDRAYTELLAAGFVGGAISPEAARRWARRSGGWPLGVREALAEGMTTGELCLVDGIAMPRRKASGRSGVGTPRHWIERRMAYLTDGERAALMALAMLGGDASDTMIDALAVGMGGPSAHSAVVVETLIASGWVARPEPGWLKLSSRTARDALLTTLNDDARRQWHLAAAGMLRHYGGLLGHADAAWYASQAGDYASAAELALDAARAAEAASLDSAAAALHQFARELHPRGTPAPMPDSVRASLTASLFPPAPETNRYPFGKPEQPADGAAGEGAAADDSIKTGELGITERAISKPPPPPLPPPPDLELDLDDALQTADTEEVATVIEEDEPAAAESLKRAPEPAAASLSDAPEPAAESLSEELAELAKQALVQGDLAQLEQLIAQLRGTGEHGDLVERMSSFVALGKGAKTEALRKLQAAADIEQPPGQRARALLAYGVALAATGQAEAALLEALAALARAREAKDLHGEEACARFLARISSATGHSTAAVAWANVVKRVTSMPRD